MAALDVCTNKVTQIKFCDEEGHDIQITTWNMIKVHYLEGSKVVLAAYHKLKEILAWDIALSKGEYKGTEYDASLEKSDDELKLKETKEGHTRSGGKWKKKKPNFLATRDKKRKKIWALKKKAKSHVSQPSKNS